MATDDERILACAREFEVPILRTRPEHRTGTDRIAEAADQLELAPDTLVVNIQGDQPFFPFPAVTELVAGIGQSALAHEHPHLPNHRPGRDP